jgi:V8-like Glu-specific endopeptidase
MIPGVRGLVFLALLVLATSAWAAPPDGRIVNGHLTAGEYPATAALLWGAAPETAGLSCSATLIGCRTVLTAAHCVCDTIGSECQPGGIQAPDPSDYSVYLQNSGLHRATDIKIHPSYDFPTADVAVIHLTEAVQGIVPTPINTGRKPPNGSYGTIVGFGLSGEKSGDYGLKRIGHIETTGCGTSTLVCWEFANPIGPRGEDSNTCYGDSGGPLFWDDGAGDVVAGITSGGTGNLCRPFDEAFDANVFHYRTWIQNNAIDALGPASCGAGPQVGDSDTAVTTTAGLLSRSRRSATHSFLTYPASGRLVVALNHDETASFDLLVKHGSPPTEADYDCRRTASGAFSECLFDAPTPGTWHARIERRSGSGEYQLTATAFGICDGATEGQFCDDGNLCTEDDSCRSSICIGDPVGDGVACDDGRACSRNDSCLAGSCTGDLSPMTGCKVGDAGASTLLLGGDPELLFETAVPAGESWRPTRKGWRYRDAGGSAGGISTLVLKAGAAGKASVTLKAKGENFSIPTLPLLFPPGATMQIVGTNACFSATFTAATKNDPSLVKARN